MSLWDDLTAKSLHVDKVIDAESGGDPNVVSPKGAIGLMQITPETGRMFGVTPDQLRDPAINRRVGTQYLAYLQDKYGGDMRLVHAAYNWGPAHVDRTGNNPDQWPAETRNYVDKIMGPAEKPMSLWDKLQQRAGAAPTGEKAPDALPATKITSSDAHNFHYDPTQAEQIEPGVTQGLQPSMIQPADLATFGAQGFTEAAGEAALREGTGMLAPEALKAGLGAAGRAAAGIPISGLAQEAAAPLTQAIPTDTPAGVLARGTAEGLAGAAPFIAPGAAGGLADRLSSRFFAKPELEATAAEAAAKTEAENVETQGKLEQAAGKEAAAQKKATAEAAQKAGESRQAARESTIKGVEDAQARMAATTREADAKAAEATVNLQKTAAQAVLPEAKEAALQSAAGNPPSPYMPQGPERIARDAQFRETITAPLTKWRQDWGTRRDALLADHLSATPDLAPLREGIQKEESKWIGTGHRPYSPVVARLLDDTAALGQERNIEGSVNDVVRGAKGVDPQTKARFTQLLDQEYATKGEHIKPARLRQIAAQAMGVDSETPTVKDLLARQAEANKIANVSKGPDRVGALAVSHAIDETLADYAPTDELKSLNAEYRDHRQSFPYDFDNTVRSAAQPLEVAPELFRYPQRALDLANLGDEKTRQAMGQLYAQWVGQNGARVIDPSHSIFLSKLFPNTPLAQPDSWVYADKAENAIADLVNASPQVKAKWDAAVQAGVDKIKREYAQSLVKLAVRDAGHYGPLGNQLITRVRLAKTPEEAADLVADFYSKLTPEAAWKARAPGEQTVAHAAAAAQMAAPHAARQAAQNFQPADPDAAAVQALMERGYKPTALWQGLKNRAKFWGPLAAGGVMISGHPSGYALAGLAMAAPVGVRELMVRSFQNSLRDEATATAFYNALKRPSEPANWKLLTSEAARAGLATAIEHAGGDAAALLNPGTEPQEDATLPPPPDPREKAPLPTLDAEWHAARAGHDTAQAGQIRNIVVRRLKAGEWKSLDPNTKRELASFIREIGIG